MIVKFPNSKRYDRAIWIRALGNGLTALVGGMLIPFLTLHLYNDLGKSLIFSTLIVSLQPLTDIVLNIFLNGISDKYGRRKLMMFALILQIIAMAGLCVALHWWLIALFIMLNGAGRFLFIPAANAQIADVVSEDHRAEVFGLLGTAKSVGGLFGPAVGVFLFSISPKLVFGTAAVALIIYFLAIFAWIPESCPVSKEKVEPGVRPLFRYRDHGPLFAMMVLTIPLSFLFAQLETNWPIFLKMNFLDYLRVFAIIETVGSFAFIFLEFILARVTERLATKHVVPFSYFLFLIAALGFTISSSLYVYILLEIILCAGAILAFNHLQKKVSTLAPVAHRGRYFSIYGAHWDLSRATGPMIGALIMSSFGGKALFLTAAILLIIGGAAQTLLMVYLDKIPAANKRVINE